MALFATPPNQNEGQSTSSSIAKFYKQMQGNLQNLTWYKPPRTRCSKKKFTDLCKLVRHLRKSHQITKVNPKTIFARVKSYRFLDLNNFNVNTRIFSNLRTRLCLHFNFKKKLKCGEAAGDATAIRQCKR